MSAVRDAARGKWRGILPALGVHLPRADARHCACPICRAGKDRFRFDDKEGLGTWICGQCGAGSGFDLVMKLRGIGYAECAKLVEEVLGGVAAQPIRPGVDPEKQRAAAARLWNAASRLSDSDGVEAYLAARGLATRSSALRFVDRCRTSRGEHYPAMLAQVCDAEGKALTVHRTYLAGDRKAQIDCPRELMPGRLSDGCAVRLSPAEPVLGIAEGVETALAAAELFGVPVWAALTAGMMERWTPPEGTRRVVICGDNDSAKSFAGEKAAYALAHKLAGKVTVEMQVAPEPGDWADILLKRRAARGETEEATR